MLRLIVSVLSAAVVMLATVAAAAPVVTSVGGDATTASIQAQVDAFRTALGADNGNAPGPLPSGRREINWDGGGSTNTAPLPPVTPFDVFLNIRGAQFTTPGTGLTQGPPSGGAQGGLETLFNNLTYDTTFGTFSSPRLFAPEGSNIIDALFFVPGTGGAIPATVGAFGAVFTDVDLAQTTRIDYFDQFGGLLVGEFVPPGTVADGSLSFLGVRFDGGEKIARVRITLGNSALGPDDNPAAGLEIVLPDDFIFFEPQAIDEPSTLALLGLAAFALLRTWRSARPRRTAF